MKIRLLCNMPVGLEHGMTAGREFEIHRSAEKRGRGTAGVWVVGDAGEEVKVYRREYEIVEDDNG